MKNLYTIIWPFCIFSPEDKIKNTNFKGKYNELKNLLFYWIDQWNNIIYAFNKTKDLSSDFDPRFYYQSILFNLYMLWSICQRIEADILGDGDNLKNLRDNIAHMDEKLKKPLNTVLINDVYKDAIIKENWVTNIGVSLVGLQIDLNTWIVASPLWIVWDTIFSTLQPSEQSSYTDFVSYKITKESLIDLQNKLLKLLNKYFSEIKWKNTEQNMGPLEILK